VVVGSRCFAAAVPSGRRPEMQFRCGSGLLRDRHAGGRPPTVGCRQRGLAVLHEAVALSMTRTEPKHRWLQPVMPVALSVQPVVAKCGIGTFLRYNTLRSDSDPTTIHGDTRRGFGTVGAMGATPMGCI
jgi:hypothetical protein